MLVTTSCVSVGEESKRGLKEGTGRGGGVGNEEGNSISFGKQQHSDCLGSRGKTKHKGLKKKNSFEKCSFKVIKLSVSKPASRLSQPLRQ